ncbi:hypothetical protein PMAYCL1PPCAC_18677 [Pristionchus mayeri]|uniref:Metalloendopeptidase n=1 Tax=Pristionchus mayeri TaxID=1317129 RepID=A0AAN5CQ25_9BILA|nr:hypothetical protein PMAYCL1PPCAC_18677 [Pristionchus mayeri]
MRVSWSSSLPFLPLFILLSSSISTLPFVDAQRRSRLWMLTGGDKFQGDIDGVDASLLHEPKGFVLFNALKNRGLRWPNGVIPYELDPNFTAHELEVMKKAFSSYSKSTCIRFEPRDGEKDFLNVVKGYGCYSQVGRTGGKQEISLGRGCLFHEIVVHELMHAVGFWHEHSRADRDDHIKIVWENILPGMKSQFDKISAALQDTQGEAYDYRSIMHYDSTAFSKNGKDTITTVVNGFTSVIGQATDLSKNDIIKINKLYECPMGERKKTQSREEDQEKEREMKLRKMKEKNGGEPPGSGKGKRKCVDHFVDCAHFSRYCDRPSFFFIMKSYCPRTCRHCTEKEMKKDEERDEEMEGEDEEE